MANPLVMQAEVLPRTVSMTFGRPQAIPENYIVVEFPLNQSLDTLSSAASSTEAANRQSTVCSFIATM